MVTMPIRVTLNNPEEVKNFLIRAGKFASTCKTTNSNDKEEHSLSDSVYRRIGVQCLTSEHYSAMYHLHAEFLVEGVSRVCTHQLVRHNNGANYCQESAVFNVFKLSSERFTCPQAYKDAGLEDEFYSVCASASDLYDKAVDLGITSSDARYILPMALNGAISVGVDIPELIHISHLRLCQKAQWEIRQVVSLMVNEITKLLPELKQAFTPKCLYMNGCNERYSCGFYTAYKAKEVPSKTPTSKVEKRHIEHRLKIRECTKCGNTLFTLDAGDDAQIGYKEGEPFLCRACRREE